MGEEVMGKTGKAAPSRVWADPVKAQQRIGELEAELAFLETYQNEAAFQAVQIAEREWLAKERELAAENQRLRELILTAERHRIDWAMDSEEAYALALCLETIRNAAALIREEERG